MALRCSECNLKFYAFEAKGKGCPNCGAAHFVLKLRACIESNARRIQEECEEDGKDELF